MTADLEVVDVDAEVVHAPPQPSNLFRTDDPVEVVQRATKVADALKGVIAKQGLTSNISGREHVRVEGWTTLGSMLGVVPVVTWTRPLERGWEARVEARTLDGRVIGAAEAQCTRDEGAWERRDDYALRSMAQTRATSKALRGPLGFIVTLAGFESTPAEEMPVAGAASVSGGRKAPAGSLPPELAPASPQPSDVPFLDADPGPEQDVPVPEYEPEQPPSEPMASEKQVNFIRRLCQGNENAGAVIEEVSGQRDITKLTKRQASAAIERLRS